jgi:hypothetical protein
LTNKTLNDFIGNGQASVLILLSCSDANVGYKCKSSPREGIFYSEHFPSYDRFSEVENGAMMAEDQVKKVHEERVVVADWTKRKDTFHILSWTVTLQNVVSSSIEYISTAWAYNSLFAFGYPAFTTFSYPNVLLMDFFASNDLWMKQGLSEKEMYEKTTDEVLALAMAINLRKAGQNCYVKSLAEEE